MTTTTTTTMRTKMMTTNDATFNAKSLASKQRKSLTAKYYLEDDLQWLLFSYFTHSFSNHCCSVGTTPV